MKISVCDEKFYGKVFELGGNDFHLVINLLLAKSEWVHQTNTGKEISKHNIDSNMKNKLADQNFHLYISTDFVCMFVFQQSVLQKYDLFV